ncbi:predicted protein [Pyrenophora tritici-repentis Pt-1C-BFP]|uniref:Uncharacterized protein n=1 Tax=Pyrenophora tritici-repentis (strain Pt-1C-BFP) TaxID=426418 RepID=B2W092_PYRTR|nr:uncharacterized protein PTRG_03082 [Pyrenophora tritici-repentis Pt-1C-BFP]EDU45605.1 predicted protein [Pyrenophora tritici-repentis Pt-1C-BFP]
MTHPTSPRLPGVPILMPSASGPEYSRWRRGVQFVLESKGTWKYCDGSLPMPMPKTRRSSSMSTKKTKDTQPSLLEERRAWVRQDREVKLDIFLSLAEEVMQDVFEVGPPLPPTNHSAQQLLEALDARFAVFNFESYHHAFCHFLNLHIDQYDSMQEFNQEFKTVLEDLLDYGHPLTNAQACSAYFSKLRCTQNPWVAQKLEEWGSYSSRDSGKEQSENEPNIYDLMQESPPWSCVRPLATKSSQTFHTQQRRQQRRRSPIPKPEGSEEEQYSSPNTSRSSSPSNSGSTPPPTHSSSISTLPSATSSRPLSNNTTHSQEITVYASKSTGGGVELDAKALHAALEKLSSASYTTTTALPRPSAVTTKPQQQQQQQLKSESITPPWLAPLNRPLPPLPPPSPPPPVKGGEILEDVFRPIPSAPRARAR